ncbi:MAG: N-acetylmuramoyl-L-alanine amidase [Colwellia sp.]|nr:N-acetylmuramoyl-L-alanine amidase [Colwellia sp.]
MKNYSEDLLTVNEYSRPATKLKSVKKIVIHWVANPETNAYQNRRYFENRKKGETGYGSTHYIVDDNVILQMIPDNEMAYHVGSDYYTEYGREISSYPNARTLGIEICHPDWTGKPTEATYDNLIELLVELCKRYKLNPISAICRHYDITTKDCPKYYVDNVAMFWKLKSDVRSNM